MEKENIAAMAYDEDSVELCGHSTSQNYISSKRAHSCYQEDSDEESEEYEHCCCPQHQHQSPFAQSRFHEVLLEFFSGHMHHESDPNDEAMFQDRKFYKSMSRDRFAADWGSVRTGVKSEGELKHVIGKVPQQLSRPRVVLLADKVSERSHPGVEIHWAKKTPRISILMYYLELRIQNCKEMDSWVLIYQGTDKSFTCTRLPRGYKCSFRVRGENDNGSGKWSEETFLVVPGKIHSPRLDDSTSYREDMMLQSKKKKKKKKKKQQEAGSEDNSKYRAELNEILRAPSVEKLERFVNAMVDSPSPSAKSVLSDATAALQIKKEDSSLRNHIKSLEKQSILQQELRKLQQNGDTSQLEACIASAKEEGISVKEAEKILAQLKVASIRETLQHALSSSNINQLENAINMAERWENSHLHSEIQACNRKIKELELSIAQGCYDSQEIIQKKIQDVEMPEPAGREEALSRLKYLSQLPDKEISTGVLLQAIHFAMPWSSLHPFLELIQDCHERIQIHHEITFGRKLLSSALRSENMDEIKRCLLQVVHMKMFGLENEIIECREKIERMHVSELRRLLTQYCVYPRSIPDIQQIIQQAIVYKDVLYLEIRNAQEKLNPSLRCCCAECNRCSMDD